MRAKEKKEQEEEALKLKQRKFNEKSKKILEQKKQK